MTQTVLLTGGTGFVGRALSQSLSNSHRFSVVQAVRRANHSSAVREVVVGDIDAHTDWRDAVRGVEVLIHAAARVHVMNETAADAVAEFRKVNVDGTLNLARQAVAAGVKRFIFISSIKVNGEGTAQGRPYTVHDAPAPIDAYGISKLEAEQGLHQLAAETGMEIVIIRPVLVYGPGVKANFMSLMRWVSQGIPLPLGIIHNRRSIVFLDNLVDLIIKCIAHPAAANQTFLVSDGEDLSTTELLNRMGKALGKPARLLPVPGTLLELGASLLGKRAVAQRLLGSLQVDISHTRNTLDWKPPVAVDDGLARTARFFLEQQQGKDYKS